MVRHVLDVDLAFVGHEANNREDDEAGEDACGTVGAGDNQSVPGGGDQSWPLGVRGEAEGRGEGHNVCTRVCVHAISPYALAAGWPCFLLFTRKGTTSPDHRLPGAEFTCTKRHKQVSPNCPVPGPLAPQAGNWVFPHCTAWGKSVIRAQLEQMGPFGARNHGREKRRQWGREMPPRYEDSLKLGHPGWEGQGGGEGRTWAPSSSQRPLLATAYGLPVRPAPPASTPQRSQRDGASEPIPNPNSLHVPCKSLPSPLILKDGNDPTSLAAVVQAE